MLQVFEDSATKIFTSWIAVIGTVTSALITVTGVIINVLITRKNHWETLKFQNQLKDREEALGVQLKSADAFFNERLAEKKQEFDLQIEVKRQIFQKEMETIKACFEDENAEKSARRDYEYEARQRLYKEIEPLLFQLTEKGEETLYRIFGLVGESKNGNLTSTGGWLSDPTDYYAISNMYRFIAPLAVIKIMQRKLTAVDLGLVPHMNALYTIGRYLSWSFTDDFVIKNIENLSYDPNNQCWAKLREENPSVYWRQGIPTGRLDKVVSTLIDKKTGQCISFGVFEDEWRKDGSSLKKTFEIVFDLFRDFHPKTRPILWRIILIQAHLYFALMTDRDKKNSAEHAVKLVVPLRGGKGISAKNFDWRQDSDQITKSEDVFILPFETAESYLRSRLKEVFDDESLMQYNNLD